MNDDQKRSTDVLAGPLITVTAIFLAVIATALAVLAYAFIRGDLSKPSPAILKAAVSEQHRDDVAWMKLRISTRLHMQAVLAGSHEVPDSDLDYDIVVYANDGKPLLRKHVEDPTPKLAALRIAADDLRPLDGPRVDCRRRVLGGEDKKCTAYFDAILSLFGRDL